MKLLKRIGIVVFVTFGAVLLLGLFISKERLFVYGVDALRKEGIALCPESWHFDALGGELENTIFTFQNRPVAQVRKLVMKPWYLHAERIGIKGLIKEWIPGSIDVVDIRPFEGKILSKGDFGRLEGFIDWRKKQIHLILYPSSQMRRNYAMTLSNFRYDKKAKVYRYDALAF